MTDANKETLTTALQLAGIFAVLIGILCALHYGGC